MTNTTPHTRFFTCPALQILPNRSDNYRSSTTDQQNRQLYSARPIFGRVRLAALDSTTSQVRSIGEHGFTLAMYGELR